MKKLPPYLILLLCFISPLFLSAQQHVAIISRCGGVDTVIIPTITDRDSDGMDDGLEQRLLNRFMPIIIGFSNENCPGPALDGTGDTNLIVARITPYPGQYTRTSSLDSLLVHPVPVVAAKHLVPGLIWYNPFIMVHCAVLYGEDCGALGHKADVEGFHFSLKYIGPDTLSGWMYDTILSNWMGVTLQSVSHDGTLCQHIETRPYKSSLVPTGLDTVYASPNKHGNYLTIGDCNSSFICNPGCNSAQVKKTIVNVNVGEPWASLVPDLGAYYTAYTGNNPWSSANFLDAQGGDAGAIADKMARPLSSDFAVGQTLTTAQICPLYLNCYGVSGSALSAYTCFPATYNFYGQNLSGPGVYTKTFTNSYGCDSTVSLTLSAFGPTSNTITAYTCLNVPYNFRGRALTTAGTYTDTLTNMHGCDSILVLNLSVTPLAYNSVNASACTGANYNFYGQQLTAPGIYTDTLTGPLGCDSIISLTLTYNPLPAVSWALNADTVLLTDNAITLSGALLQGGTYSGAGVSGNSFYPDSAGPGNHVINYLYTDSLGCSNSIDQSIVVIAVTGINEIDITSGIQLYPNPVNSLLTFSSKLFVANEVAPVVYDVTGNKIAVPYHKEGNSFILNVKQIAPGMYWVRLNVNGINVIKKFVKTE